MTNYPRTLFAALAGVALVLAGAAYGDGKVFPPANYTGSLEESSQEAIIIFEGGSEGKSAKQDLVLKIRVEGSAESFGWVVPFPSVPKTAKEDDKLFKELFDYVAARNRPPATPKSNGASALGAKTDEKAKAVEVISRKVVGSYDVAIVKENEAGGLNGWLKKEKFQPLKGAEDVIGFYRKKDYVFACMKVSDLALKGAKNQKSVDLHPLRFSFETGGRDGIYFPMKMTGLQKEPFDVNLYIFYRAWLNDDINKFGYEHRGFRLNYRDWDTPQCPPNEGKVWSLPEKDPFLSGLARKIPTLKKFFQKRYPGDRFYLTNIQARRMKPEDVREWRDDLWLFPFYTKRGFIPFDAREGGAAAAAWNR